MTLPPNRIEAAARAMHHAYCSDRDIDAKWEFETDAVRQFWLRRAASVETAARALAENDENDWAVLSAAVRKSYRGHARAALDAAYPELANGTAWIAPRSTTEDMLLAGRDALRLPSRDHVSAADHVQKIYCAMRDAFLQEPKDNGT